MMFRYKKSAETVDMAFKTLKELLISYPFKPGERFNESELVKRPCVSRAPLRQLTCKQLGTCLDIVRNLGHRQEYGFAMPGRICSVP